MADYQMTPLVPRPMPTAYVPFCTDALPEPIGVEEDAAQLPPLLAGVEDDHPADHLAVDEHTPVVARPHHPPLPGRVVVAGRDRRCSASAAGRRA